MQSYSSDAMHVSDENSYCPDYTNRERTNKKDKKTLEEFCIDANLPFVKFYRLG